MQCCTVQPLCIIQMVLMVRVDPLWTISMSVFVIDSEILEDLPSHSIPLNDFHAGNLDSLIALIKV